MTRPTRVAIWKVLLPTLYSQADGCYCCHRRKHNSVTSLVCVVTLLMVRSAMIPRKVPQSSHKVFLKCGNSERSQQCPGCCLSVTELSPARVACRLNILDYHDLTPTLSRFSRYVWRAAGRRGPYAHICRGEPGGLVYTRSQCADISHSAEIPGNQNDEIVADGPVRPTSIDGYYWTTGWGLAQFTLRILECENGWRQTNSTARFRFCSILGRLCLFDAHSSKWQENARGWVAPSYISTRPVTLSAQSWASSLTVCPALF